MTRSPGRPLPLVAAVAAMAAWLPATGSLLAESAETWFEEALLTGAPKHAGDGFAEVVDVHQGRVFASNWGDDTLGLDSGAAHVFERDPTTGEWIRTAKLIHPLGDPEASFGTSVVADEGTLYVPVQLRFDPEIPGQLLYEKGADGWVPTDFLFIREGGELVRFGPLDIAGDRMISGDTTDMDQGYFSGAAYIFERDPESGEWRQTPKLLPSDGEEQDRFGTNVAIAGDTAFVASPWDDDFFERSGSVYLFERDPATGVWSESGKLYASEPSEKGDRQRVLVRHRRWTADGEVRCSRDRDVVRVRQVGERWVVRSTHRWVSGASHACAAAPR